MLDADFNKKVRSANLEVSVLGGVDKSTRVTFFD